MRYNETVENLRLVYSNFKTRLFSIATLAKTVFPEEYEKNRNKAVHKAAEIVKAGMSSHYNIIEYPSKVLSNNRSPNIVSPSNLLRFENSVIFKIKNTAYDYESLDNRLFKILEQHKDTLFTVSSITTKYDFKEFKVRRALNRLYILNMVDVKTGSKTNNYVIKKDAVQSPVIRKRKKTTTKKIKEGTMKNIDMLRNVFDVYGKKAFSVEDAAEILFPDISESQACNLVSKLIVKSSKAYQVFDYRDVKVSDEYGGITNVTEDLALKAKSQRIFVFRNVSSLDRDKRVLNALRNKVKSQKEGFYKKEIMQMFPNIGDSTINRSLVRLWVTRKIEKNVHNKYVPSDGKIKVIAPNSKVKVDKKMYERVDFLLSNTWDVFTDIRNKFKDEASVEQIVHYLWKDKTHIVKYPALIDKTVRTILEKGNKYKVFKIKDRTIALRAQVIDLHYDHYKKRDLEFLKIVDLTKGNVYTMHDIEERYKERVLDNDKRDVFRTLIRLRIMGFLKKIPEKKEHGKFVFEYMGVAGEEVNKEKEGSVARNTGNIVSFQKPEFVEEDRYEESLDNELDADPPKVEDYEEKQPTPEVSYPVPETLIYNMLQKINDDWYRNNFYLEHFKPYFNCDDYDVKRLIENKIIVKVASDMYSFMVPDMVDLDNNTLYSIYDIKGTASFCLEAVKGKGRGNNTGRVNSLYRLVLEKRILMSKIRAFTSTSGYEYAVDPKEVGFSGDNSFADLTTHEESVVEKTYVPAEAAAKSSFVRYALDTSNNETHKLILSGYQNSFSTPKSCSFTLDGDSTLFGLLFSLDNIFTVNGKVWIHELDFSNPHMFSEKFVGDNCTKGYIVICDNSEDAQYYLYVPHKIPVLE